MQPIFQSSRRLPPEETWARGVKPRARHEVLDLAPRECPCEHPRGAPPPAGQRGTAATRFHRRSRTSTRPFSARCRERLQGRVRFFGFCRWMFPRARLGTARTSRATGVTGTTALFDRKFPSDRIAAEGTQGQGSRTPCLDTPHRDCSRRRLRPNPDRFGHLLSRTPVSSLSGVTWGENDAAFAARACKARVARGPCGA
jgi:hypothetical protein